MRKIKFRAWDIKNKRMMIFDKYWLCDEYQSLAWKIKEESKLESEGGYCLDCEEISELMQFTGLKDKNGKEIYEEDIVKFNGHTNEDKFMAIIVFSNGMFRPEQWYEPLGNYKHLEVIGNIYENSELLNDRT